MAQDRRGHGLDVVRGDVVATRERGQRLAGVEQASAPRTLAPYCTSDVVRVAREMATR